MPLLNKDKLLCVFLLFFNYVITAYLRGRHGYGNRVAQSGVIGTKGTMDLHAIGATMEDVGKNVMANMSGNSSLSLACSGVIASEGQTLKNVSLSNLTILKYLFFDYSSDLRQVSC